MFKYLLSYNSTFTIIFIRFEISDRTFTFRVRSDRTPVHRLEITFYWRLDVRAAQTAVLLLCKHRLIHADVGLVFYIFLCILHISDILRIHLRVEALGLEDVPTVIFFNNLTCVLVRFEILAMVKFRLVDIIYDTHVELRFLKKILCVKSTVICRSIYQIFFRENFIIDEQILCVFLRINVIVKPVFILIYTGELNIVIAVVLTLRAIIMRVIYGASACVDDAIFRIHNPCVCSCI